MKVSVLLPACNQGKFVRQTCDSARDSLRGVDHEILVLDDQSTDGSCDGLPSWVDVIRPTSKLGCPTARRWLADMADGDVLVFADPHCTFPYGALTTMADAALRHKAVVQPRVQPLPRNRFVYGASFKLGLRGVGRRRHFSKRAARAVYGGIYAFRRDVYDATGFLPLPGRTSFQDDALSLCLWFADVPIVVLPEVTCGHWTREGYSGLPKGEYVYDVDDEDRVLNGVLMHWAFFPETWEAFWKPRMHRWRRKADLDKITSLLAAAECREHVDARRNRTEQAFFEQELGREYPA